MPDPNFDTRHPSWVADIERWQVAWDFYRGGRHVIEPGREVAHVPFWTPLEQDAKVSDSASQQSVATERVRTRRLIYEPYAWRSYLFSHVRESREEYQDRIARAMHYPLYRSIVDIYVSAVLRTDAKREPSSAQWEEYWSDVDLTGAQIDVFMRTALTFALVYGRVHAVTDAPANGGRPYTYLIPPGDLVDWLLDPQGRFIWAVVREDEPSERVPGAKHTQRRDQYRVWHRDRWELWRKIGEGKGAWTPAGNGTHSAGKVPIDTLFARRGHESRRTLESDAVLDDILDIDRAVFNLVSLLHDQVYSQVFSQLAVPTESGEAPDLELGLKRVLGFTAESGARPLYLSPDAGLISAQLALIGDHISSARTLANVGRGRAEFSKEERSAASLQEESADKNNAVSSLAGAVESFDRAVHQTVAAMRGVGNPPVATYSRDVSLKALSAQIADATSMSALGLPSEALAEIHKPLVARLLKEHGASDETIQRATEAIDARSAEVAAQVAAMPEAEAEDEPEDEAA